MDSSVINECTKLSLAGKITFPEVVMRLAATGAERYMVDLVVNRKFTYSRSGDFYEANFEFTGPEIAPDFNADAVKSAIKDIQQQKIDYQTFLRRVMEAGCCHYEVYINGKKAVYVGRNGNSHTELFPQAA